MATTASSGNPWSVGDTLLQSLEIIHRSYGVSVPTVPPRVMTTARSLPTHLQYLHPVTKRILGFHILCYSAPEACLTEVHFRLGGNFDLPFLQIPHWPISYRFILHQAVLIGFFGHPWFVYSFPPFEAEVGITPTRCCPYRAHREKLAALFFSYPYDPDLFSQQAKERAGRESRRAVEKWYEDW